MLNANIYKLLKQKNPYKIFIFKDSIESTNALEVFKYLKLIDKNFPNFYILSDLKAKKGDDLRSYSLELSELLLNLHYFYNDPNSILLSPLHSLLNPLPKASFISPFMLKINTKHNFSSLQNKLINYGFENVELVTTPHETSTHGDIIDIFPFNYTSPIRISFFDDEIESIRFFDVVSQMCFGDELSEVSIHPAVFSLSEDEFNQINESILNSSYDVFTKDIQSLGLWFIDGCLLTNKYKSLLSKGAFEELKELSQLESLKNDINFDDFLSIDEIIFDESYSDLYVDSNNLEKLFSFHNRKNKTLLSMNSLFVENLKLSNEVNILESNIYLNIVTPNELILSTNKPSKVKHKNRKTIILNELNIGDYVVHEDYGIGIFKGLTQTKILGNISDFVEIAYLNNDKLLLPTYNLNLISKYTAIEGSIPLVDRLGKGSFAKIKQKLKPKLLEIAQEIINTAASRELIKGKLIDVDNVDYLIFKNKFNFEFTKDQEVSIKEILLDLKSGKVMDRILIGDVGFGKTEVAMHAIFCVIKSGYQVALMAPTSILAMQHFKTLQERFSGFDIKIIKLDRFNSNKQLISDDIANGKYDLIVGTHSLLNISFLNLGLVVLDEEHKFGVKQKEKLKILSKDVHLLSMSATPIPRTLNMTLSSLKTKSELNTPPLERIPPKTFVKNYNNLILKDAILRELNRRGQIFYIHNNISSINDKKDELLKLLPKLRIAILHSKINQIKTEDIMFKFSNGEFDLLLSTSIVESGIHFPNANTIIVDSADRFGMADLHQLRGRIGRGNKEGYCYFFVENKENITFEAKRRLLSLESNSFLGVGGVLSYSDLEIRGGGNILGEAQSGHIKNIGYSLYFKMLEESINELSGNSNYNNQNVDIKLNVSAFIDPSIIPSDRIRLDFYRRLANAKEISDVYKIEEEIIDRFGKLDSYTVGFLKLILIKILAINLNIKKIMNYNQNITIINENDERTSITASSIDDSDIVEATLVYLRNEFNSKNINSLKIMD